MPDNRRYWDPGVDPEKAYDMYPLPRGWEPPSMPRAQTYGYNVRVNPDGSLSGLGNLPPGWYTNSLPYSPGAPGTGAPTAAPTAGSTSGGYSWNPGPYNVGAPGWAQEHYGMRGTGSTYNNVRSGRSNGGRNWQDIMENGLPKTFSGRTLDQQIDYLRQAINTSPNNYLKGGSSMGLLQKQRQLKLLMALKSAQDQGWLPNGGGGNGGNGGGNGYGNGNGWSNGLVNWSI